MKMSVLTFLEVSYSLTVSLTYERLITYNYNKIIPKIYLEILHFV
jgi:hypothetical protein